MDFEKDNKTNNRCLYLMVRYADRCVRIPSAVSPYICLQSRHFSIIHLYNEELNDLYSSPNIVRVIKSRRTRWAGHVARMGEDRVVYRVLVGRPEGKRPLGRLRCRWDGSPGVGMWVYGLDWAGPG